MVERGGVSRFFEHGNKATSSTKCRTFLDQVTQFATKDPIPSMSMKFIIGIL
jgi:hypothetical protein